MTITDIRAHVLVPICPHCSTEVKESTATPGWAFCPHQLCRKGPWIITTLPKKKVVVKDAGNAGFDQQGEVPS